MGQQCKQLRQEGFNIGYDKGISVWKCDVCGHVHVGLKAPKLCPICKHESSFVPYVVTYNWTPKKK